MGHRVSFVFALYDYCILNQVSSLGGHFQCLVAGGKTSRITSFTVYAMGLTTRWRKQTYT